MNLSKSKQPKVTRQRDQPIVKSFRPVFAGDQVEISSIGEIGKYGEPTGSRSNAKTIRRDIAMVYSDAKKTTVKDSAGDVWSVYWSGEKNCWIPMKDQSRLI